MNALRDCAVEYVLPSSILECYGKMTSISPIILDNKRLSCRDLDVSSTVLMHFKRITLFVVLLRLSMSSCE